MSRTWLAHVPGRPGDADLAAPLRAPGGQPAGWLAAWVRPSKPVRDARRIDPRVLDAAGPPTWISLLLPARALWPLFDDAAVIRARQAVLADAQPPDAVTTMVADSSRFAGALTARRGPGAAERLRDDPFARVLPARVLQLGGGLVGTGPPLGGPVTERRAGEPWPWNRWSAP
jgi:hypothetical protein